MYGIWSEMIIFRLHPFILSTFQSKLRLRSLYKIHCNHYHFGRVHSCPAMQRSIIISKFDLCLDQIQYNFSPSLVRCRKDDLIIVPISLTHCQPFRML